jgi:hypothetical protein
MVSVPFERTRQIEDCRLPPASGGLLEPFLDCGGLGLLHER